MEEHRLDDVQNEGKYPCLHRKHIAEGIHIERVIGDREDTKKIG